MNGSLVCAALVVGTGLLQAQEVKVNALIISWYHQAMDSNLRLNPASPYPYYAFGGATGAGTLNPMRENGFSVRRTEIYLNGKISDEVSGLVIFEPKEASPILLDAFALWKPLPQVEVKVGQYKPLQSYEATSVSSSDLIFIDRSQFARRYGDIRDRGIVGAYTFGSKEQSVKVSLGVFNGANRDNDANAQKDFIYRIDVVKGPHKVGLYGLQGSTDVKDLSGKAIAPATSWTPTAPNQQAIYDHKDATSNLGVYYWYTHGPWHFDAEVVTGKLGRRFATLAAASPTLKREHLDQRFLTYWVTGTYTRGRHSLCLRYDRFAFNQGSDWYPAYNPYTTTASGPRGADYTPTFTETTLGYTYAINPKLIRQANFKLDYILRSKNILAPRVGQTGEQGGDSLVAAFQISF